MPDFEFTAPSGKKYTVSGPAGSTSEQAFQMLQTQIGGAPATPDSEGKAQGKRIMAAVDQVNHEEGKLFIGAGETALNLASGVGSTVAGGIRGLWNGVSALANGKSFDNAVEIGAKSVEDTQHDFTYQPRTGVGKLGSELATVPIMAAKSALTEIGGDIGQAVNGAQGRLAGESLGNVAPDVAATLLGGRAAMRGPSRSPIVEQAPPAAVNYDIPAYQRNGVKPVPEIAGPVGPPAPEPIIAPPVVPVPTLPPSIPGPVMRSPVESYAAAPIKSPYGELLEPLAPEAVGPTSALDAYAGRTEQAPSPRAVPNQFDDMLREAGPDAPAPKSPLDALIEGDATLPAAKITAPLRDMSDIDGILQSFGVKSPDAPTPIPGPSLPIAMPLEAVERATGPVAPLDSTLRVPEPVVAAIPEAAPVPAAPIPGPIAPPEPVAPTPIPGPARQVAPEVAAALSEAPFVATPEQHVNPALRDQNLQALRDVGLENIRESAVTGNAAQAAREFQHGKITSEPAGQYWFDQFQAETEAMKNHAQRIVDNTGGRTGLDESALTRKGMDIAAPYDAAREYFEKAKGALYKQADEAAGGLPSVKLDGLSKLLDTDSVFEGRAEKSALRKGVRAYLREQSIVDADGQMQPITAKSAEGLRKYLNGEWSPQNAGLIGKIKGMLDKDVFKSAGADIYAEGRKMHMLEKQTLDNPNGIAKLMDADPNTPVNRNTAYERIPDKIMTLSEDQFKHIIDTYRELPPELQPLAKQAIATLKAHYAERILDAGTETGRGNPRQLWNAGGVKSFASDNSAKIPMIFDMAELQQIDSMLKAGEVLRVNPAYPGAAAQLANASKAGMMTHLLGRAGGGFGALVGSVAGPGGAVGGAVAGEAAAGALMKRTGERKALAEAKAAIINEHRTAPRTPSAVDAWEAEYR